MHHRPQRIRHRVAAVLATLALVAGSAAGCSTDGPDDTVKDFLTGWRSGDLRSVGFIAADGSKISASDVLDQLHDLSGDLARQSLVLTTAGETRTTGDIASSPIKLDWTLPGGVPWSYQSTVRLTKKGTKGWRVVWEPAIVQQELVSGDKLALRRLPAQRAGILDAVGRPIVTPRDVVTVGVSPPKITNLAQLRTDLAAAFKKIG